MFTYIRLIVVLLYKRNLVMETMNGISRESALNSKIGKVIVESDKIALHVYNVKLICTII